MDKMRRIAMSVGLVLMGVLSACGSDDDDGGTEADKQGIGASCTNNDDCFEQGQTCLSFKGGYCGAEDCKDDMDCPSGSRCVSHTAPAKNFCFRVCGDKSECNRNRPADSEANCSANVVFSDGKKGGKACVPPS